MRYALALIVAAVLGPFLVLFGLSAVAGILQPLILLVLAVYALRIAILLVTVDGAVLRLLFPDRFDRLRFVLAMLVCGTVAGVAVAVLLSPTGRAGNNLGLFVPLGLVVALSWSILRPSLRKIGNA